jgi:hypothetical protein
MDMAVWMKALVESCISAQLARHTRALQDSADSFLKDKLLLPSTGQQRRGPPRSSMLLKLMHK